MKKKLLKALPKIQKSITGFLTDESGKITKKDALSLSFWSAAAFTIPYVFWKGGGGHSSRGSHWNNWCAESFNHTNAPHSNVSHSNGGTWGHVNQVAVSWASRWTHLSGVSDTNHNVPNVNGHFSGVKSNPWPWRAGHVSGHLPWSSVSQSAINARIHGNSISHSSSHNNRCAFGG